MLIPDLLGCIVLATMALLGSCVQRKARRLLLVLALVVAAVLVYATTAAALPYPCPWEWKILRIC